MESQPNDRNSYLNFGTKQAVDRQFHEMEGILRGVTADGRVSSAEVTALRGWLACLGEQRAQAPFAEVAAVVERVVADGVVDEEELADLKWVLERWTTPNEFFSAITSDIQRLHGVIGGMLADGHVNDDEIAALADWLDEREHLRTTWPYEEIGAMLTHVRKDGRITDEERRLLTMFLADLLPTDGHHVVSIESIDLSTLTLTGICAVNPEISLTDRKVCFTGESTRGTRTELSRLAKEHGGIPVTTIRADLGYLVVGAAGNPCWAFSCYGRKIEEAMRRRRHEGATLLIIHEVDFWDAVAT